MTEKILYIILFILVGAVVLLAFEVVVQHQEIKDLLGRRNRKDKPKLEQQAEDIVNIQLEKKVHQIGCNGICLTCYFENNCSVNECDIFRDDTKQVAECWLYMRKATSKEVGKIGKIN